MIVRKKLSPRKVYMALMVAVSTTVTVMLARVIHRVGLPHSNSHSSQSRPHPAHYWRPHAELCPASGVHLRLLVMVASAPARSAARAGIRLTWGRRQRADVTVAFMVPAPPPSLRRAILSEDDLYGDLIVIATPEATDGDQLPSVISMFKWTDTYCPLAPRLLKTEDDVFINVLQLLAFVRARSSASRTIWGRVIRKLGTKRTNSKYFMTGPAYLVTADCVRPLLAEASREPYLRLEDVFVTGVLANKLGIKRVHVPEFYNRKIAPHPCAVQRTIAVHMVRYHEQFDFWRKIHSTKTICNFTRSKYRLWLPNN